MLFDQGIAGASMRAVLALAIVMGVLVPLSVWAERRLSAFLQDRRGPNRVGPWGILQGLADVVKLIFKEDVRPALAHPLLYFVAPAAAVFPAVLAFAAVPFGAREIGGRLVPLAVADLNVGVLFVLAVSSLGVFGIILGGWSSYSKYPLLGGLRAAAQMISYEVPLGLTIMAVLILAGTASLSGIVEEQSSVWFAFLCPGAFFLFVILMFAETNRLPFDMPEGEPEIIGYHAEYSGMKFSMFLMAEYAAMVTMSCLAVLLFLGGWEFLPFLGWDEVGRILGLRVFSHPVLWVLPSLWFLLKVTAFLLLYIWVRWTLPRFRYDQLMSLGWKRLVPLALFNLATAAAVVAVRG